MLTRTRRETLCRPDLELLFVLHDLKDRVSVLVLAALIPTTAGNLCESAPGHTRGSTTVGLVRPSRNVRSGFAAGIEVRTTKRLGLVVRRRHTLHMAVPGSQRRDVPRRSRGTVIDGWPLRSAGYRR